MISSDSSQTYIATSTLIVDKERGLGLVDRALYHAAHRLSSHLRLAAQSDILRGLISRADEDLWMNAVRRSLDLDDALFRTFDHFGRTLLEQRADDSEFPLQLYEAIYWAEDLMTV